MQYAKRAITAINNAFMYMLLSSVCNKNSITILRQSIILPIHGGL